MKLLVISIILFHTCLVHSQETTSADASVLDDVVTEDHVINWSPTEEHPDWPYFLGRPAALTSSAERCQLYLETRTGNGLFNLNSQRSFNRVWIMLKCFDDPSVNTVAHHVPGLNLTDGYHNNFQSILDHYKKNMEAEGFVLSNLNSCGFPGENRCIFLRQM